MIEIRADGNAALGMGHYSRCAAVAEELVQRKIPFIWVCSRDADAEFLKKRGFPFYQMKKSRCGAWSIDEESAWIREKKISTVFADSYYIKAKDFNILHSLTRIIYLDDLAAFDYDVDGIINYNIEATEALYDSGRYRNRSLYTGVRYFPLRKEIHQYKKNGIAGQVSNILISTGGTDPYQCIDQILDAVNAREHCEIVFRCILGFFTDASYRMNLRGKYGKYPNIIFLPWGQHMGERYHEADLVIAPGSGTTFEALSIGVPCLTFEFAENHHGQCVALDGKGIAPWMGNLSERMTEEKSLRIRDCFNRELEWKTRMGRFERFSGIFDGKGAERIAGIIMGG